MKFSLKNCASLLAAGLFGMVAVATPASAQTQPAQTELSLFSEADPNDRSATAVVNGYVITRTDIEQRMALVTNASQNQLSTEEEQRLRAQVLRNLIDETLQIQAAAAQEMAVEQARVNQTYLQLATQNFGANPERMDEYLNTIGSSPRSLKRQIEGELAWENLLRRNVTPFVNVAAEEVNEVLKRMEEDRGTEEYRLGEIYMAATLENREAVLNNVRQIMEQLRQGGSFQAYARQFSEASTAAVGGDLGWLRLSQLPPQLGNAARQMQIGQLNGPIEIPGGFSILYLINKRQVLMANPNDAVLSLKQISIGFPPDVTQDQANAKLQEFATFMQTVTSCDDAERAKAALGAEVVTNGQLAAGSLPAQLRDVILGLKVGEATQAFGSPQEGVRVFMLCGRQDPQDAGAPTFEQVMNQLEEERIEKRAQRYLRDLRNDAYIEYN